MQLSFRILPALDLEERLLSEPESPKFAALSRFVSNASSYSKRASISSLVPTSFKGLIVLYVDQNPILMVKSPATTIVPLYSFLSHNIGIVRPISMDQGFIRILGSAMSVRSITLYLCTFDRGDKGHLHRHLRLSSFVLVWDGFSENSIICHYQPFKMQPSKGIPVFLTLSGFLNWPLAEAWRDISWRIVYV